MVFLGNWEVHNLIDIAYFAHNRARTRDLPSTYTFILKIYLSAVGRDYEARKKFKELCDHPRRVGAPTGVPPNHLGPPYYPEPNRG